MLRYCYFLYILSKKLTNYVAYNVLIMSENMQVCSHTKIGSYHYHKLTVFLLKGMEKGGIRSKRVLTAFLREVK